MAFGFRPSDYLEIVQEQHSDFKADPLSIRKAIAVSVLANHIAEYVFATHSLLDVSKVDGCNDLKSYRQHLEKQKPELLLIRDLCDFAKHGPRLDRKTVRVTKAETKNAMVPLFQGLLLALTNHREEQKIVITFDDNLERHFDYLIEDVMNFWAALFAAKEL